MAQRTIKLSAFLISIMCLLFLLIIGILCVGVITVSTFQLVFVNNNQTMTLRLLTNFLLSPGSPVLLNDHRFDSIASVQISTNNNNPTADFNVKFFKGRCDSLKYKTASFPDSSRDLKPFADTRVAVNYFYADYPLYVAGGNSTIIYSLSSTNGPASGSDDDCLLELFSFNDESEYHKFLNSPTSLPAEGYMNKSGCLPVGKKDHVENSTVVFSLTEPNSYFFAISSAQDILTHIKISVQALEFDTEELEIVDCVLSSSTTNCKVSLDDQLIAADSALAVVTANSDICGHDNLCVWAKASNYVSINVTSIKKDEPGDDGSYVFYYSVAGSALVLVLCVCAIILFVIYQICFLLRPQRKHHTDQWQDHVVKGVQTEKSDEKKPLLPDYDYVDKKKGTIQF